MYAAGLVGALLLGVALGLLVGWLLRRRPSAPPPPTFEYRQPEVPDGVSDVLQVLRSAAIVVGPHDELLQTTTSARTYGLVRGTRIAEPDLLRLVREVREDRRIRELEFQVRRGGTAPPSVFAVRVAPLNELVLVLAEDETGARRIEQTRRDFVANVSHELKTPVGAISLLAEAVEGAADDPPAVRRFAVRMGIESARLTDLVAQIVDLSRLQADDPLTAPDEVDIDEVLAEAVDRCRVDADRRQVSLTIAGARGLRVLGNHRQLGVAVSNLVENAVIYSDPGARVVVAARPQVRSDDDYVEVTVSDNGIGIPLADQERIFERFYRVDYGRSRAHGGTGLGLAIVKHIAATHGGSVVVWSQPGQGSTFTVRIPAHLHPIGPASEPDAAEPDPASSDPASPDTARVAPGAMPPPPAAQSPTQEVRP